MSREKQKDLTNQPMLPFEITPLMAKEQANRDWELLVNGQEVAEVAHAKLVHPKMGVEVDYGKRPEGYDGFVIREPAGAVTMPYMIDRDGGIYVGVVEEFRPTMGEEKTKNVPRGFSDFGETKKETAQRELHEETGYRALGSKIVELATGLNPNSTFFDYSHSKEEGVSIFAIPVEQDELMLDHDDEGHVFYAFPAHVRNQAESDKTAERILGSRFIPIGDALQSRDMFTSAAAGQLVGYLLQNGEYLLPQKSYSEKKGRTEDA